MEKDYEAKLKRLSYFVQLLTFFITTNAHLDIQIKIKDEIRKLAEEELKEPLRVI